MSIYELLLLGHLIGTILTVGGATMIEVQLNRALADRSMSLDERVLMGLNFTTLRVGLVLSVLTGLGFIVIFKITGQDQRLESPILWAKMFILLIAVTNALLLQARKIGLYWGSALSFVSWWMIMILGFSSTNGIQYSFFQITIGYIICVVIGAFILHKVRLFIYKKHA